MQWRIFKDLLLQIAGWLRKVDRRYIGPLLLLDPDFSLKSLTVLNLRYHLPNSFCGYHNFYLSFSEALIDFALFLLDLLSFQGK